MRLRAFIVGTALVVAIGMAVIISAQTPPKTVDDLVSAAKVAAGTDWPGTFTRLCIPPPAAPGAGRDAAVARAAVREQAARRRPHRRASAGTRSPRRSPTICTSSAQKPTTPGRVVGSEGIILIEALYHYAVADEVTGGFKKLGLDVNKVKYAVMSHAHGDHDGGAAYLQDSIPGLRLLYGAPDWDAIDKLTDRPGGKPKRDMVGHRRP